jgi:hypothetical protein
MSQIQSQFNSIVYLLGFCSSLITIMTFLGIIIRGFVFNWSDKFSNLFLNILSYSFKFGLCLLIGLIFLIIGQFCTSFLQGMLIQPIFETLFGIFGHCYDQSSSYWSPQVCFPSIWISRITTIVIFVPLYLLSSSGIIKWSRRPWLEFFEKLKNDSNKP